MAFESQAVFGIAAAHDERHHLVALLPALRAAPKFHVFAGYFQTGNFGRAFRMWVMALPLPYVVSVDAGGNDFHQDLAVARGWQWLLAGDEHVRSARLADGNAGHRLWQMAFRHEYPFLSKPL